MKANNSIRDWYVATFPTDKIAAEQIFGQTFSEMAALLKSNPYAAAEYIGECDTQVRDRIIAETKARMAR